MKLDVRLRLGPVAHEAWEKLRSLVSGEERLGDDELVMALAERLASAARVRSSFQVESPGSGLAPDTTEIVARRTGDNPRK